MLQADCTPGRILMTCDAVGGIWRYAVDLSRVLEARGIETVLVGTGPRPGQAALAALARLPVWLEHRPAWLAPGSAEILRLADDLGRLQRLYGADLVHLNQPAEAAFLDVDVPVVVAAHACLASWWRSLETVPPPVDWHWRTGLEADGLRRADAVAVASEAHAAAVTAIYEIVPPAVVWNGSDVPEGPEAREPLVIAAGRWWDRGKNLGVIDAAAARIRWPVLLYGSLAGPDGTQVAARHVEARGERPPDELGAAMRRAAVFVSASLYEPFGLPALEAARSGAALVLSDIPTYRELWGEAALYFDPRSPRALAEAVEALTEDGGLLAAMAAAARRRAAMFSLDRQGAAVVALYRSLAGRRLRETA